MSAHQNKGVAEIWKMISYFETKTKSSGHFELQRQRQNQLWFHDYFMQLLNADVANNAAVVDARKRLEEKIEMNKVSPFRAASDLLKIYQQAKDR